MFTDQAGTPRNEPRAAGWECYPCAMLSLENVTSTKCTVMIKPIARTLSQLNNFRPSQCRINYLVGLTTVLHFLVVQTWVESFFSSLHLPVEIRTRNLRARSLVPLGNKTESNGIDWFGQKKNCQRSPKLRPSRNKRMTFFPTWSFCSPLERKKFKLKKIFFFWEKEKKCSRSEIR